MVVKQTGAHGYEIESAAGWVFEIGNEWVTRRVNCLAGRIGTTSLAHGLSGEEYLEGTVEEFALTLSKDGEYRDLLFRDFIYKTHSVPKADESERLLKIELEADFDNSKIPLSVCYQAQADQRVIRKWLEIGPADLPGWVIESVILENLKLQGSVEGITPLPRYPQKFANGEDNYHVESDKVDASNPNVKFSFGDKARVLVAPWGLAEGLFFFTESLLGSESFDRETGLVMRQKEYIPLTEGLKTGAAVIGAYSGPPEIGFKRYNEFLADNWLVIDDKPMPVSWNTWFVTLKDNVPLLTDYNRDLLLEYIELLKGAGFYDVLHLDLGWEAHWPMEVDMSKFPNGMDEIMQKANEAGLNLAFWLNPFSASYWISDIEKEHPEWLNPIRVSGNSHAHAICPMTGYFDYVKKRMVELAGRYKARVIYWDGGDWNIPPCSAQNHEHKSLHELEVKAAKRLAEIADAVHEANHDTMFINFTLPFNNHRLSVVDQEQVSDTYYLRSMQNVLSQRQQFYQATFEHPYRAIWGSWYGIEWVVPDEKEHTKLTFRELVHAEMSMIANGINQAGASFDLKEAEPKFVEFMKKLFAFRKRFERYFTVYQHVLGFPDGQSVDGEGHIIDGKGFIVLVNPTEEEQTVNLPLDEPELELSVGSKYEIYDWSNLEKPRPLGKAGIGDKIELDFSPLEVKYIGVGIGE